MILHDGHLVVLVIVNGIFLALTKIIHHADGASEHRTR